MVFEVLRNIFFAITVITGIKNFRTIQKLKDQGQDILATKTSQGGKIPIIYGRRRVGSTLLYMDTDSGNSKELFVIYGLCLGEVDSIELDTIEINGVPLSDTKVFRDGYYTGSDKISSGAGSLNTVSQIGTSSGSFRGDGRSGTDPTKIYRMVLNAHHGADNQTVDPMLNASQSTKFTSNHRLRGIAYIAASFQYDEKGMFTSVPELTVVVKGRKLYDPRLDGSITGGTGSHRIDDTTTYEWSNNAALTMLDYMHQDYGKGLATSSIDLQSFQTAANTADTVVDVPDYSGSYAAATFSADVEDNFITVNEATWKKIKGGELLSVKDSGGSVIINQNNVIDAQRFTPHTESTNFRIYTDGTPPAKVSKSVTFSATNGDATLTVSCTSHGASANDRVLFAGATSLGGNITTTVLNKGYTIATVVDANSFTIEATDLNLATVLANSSDTGNGGGSAVGKFMYADESGSVLTQTRRLQCDGVLDTNETVLDNARDLLSNMRGFLNYIDGKYSVLVEDATSSSFSITDDHIIDQGIKIRYEDKAEKLNKVVVQFFNAQKKYESDTKTVFHNNSTSTYKNDDGGEELETTAEFQYITNPYNAFNMGKGILERSRRQKTISFVGTPRLLNLTAGDVVTITYSPYNLSNAAYRIETINLLDNGLVGIQAIEYFDFYTWSATPPEENVGGDPDLPTGTEAEPPTNLSFTDATSTRRAFLTWTAATNYPAKEFRVIIKNSSGEEIHNRIVSDAFIDLDFIAVANGYVASITSISSTGAESSSTSIAFNVTQQPVKLGDIQANAITANEINVTNLAAISADLGSITAGSINIGSGAFTVSSSGVMTATGATVSGAITASSLNVTGATVTGTLDASVITINGEPLDDAFGVTGTGSNRVMSIGFQAQNQLKVTDTGLQYLAISTGGSGIGFEAFSVDGSDFTFYSTAAGNSQKETIVNKEGSITLSNLSSAPSGSSQTNSLYLLNGALQFNGSAVGTGTGDITAVVAGTNLNGGGTTGSVTLNLDSTITGNHTFANDVVIQNNLTVQGTTTTIDTTNLDVKDKNITLNFSSGDSSGNADGAGITIQDAVNSTTDATILWDATNDEFDFSHGITLPDDEKLQFGASNDLQIFHQTSNGNSIIKESGGGILSIQTNGAEVSIFDTANSQNMARFITGADVKLFHNGSVKLATSSTGATVTGTLTATTLAGTLSTASQPNITSVGTLTSLSSGALSVTGSRSLFSTSTNGQQTALAVTNGTGTGGYFNVKSNVGNVNTDGNVGLHIGWNKSNGGREINMIFDGGTTQADTEMIFTSTDGTTYTDIFQINGAVGTGVDIKSGGLRIDTTTVIDASRNLTNIGTINSGLITPNIASNGTLIDLQTGSASRGKIAVVSGDLAIHSSESGHKGLRFGAGFIAPTTNSTTIEDATTDLGIDSARFRNLKLSGTITLGDSHQIGDDATDNLVINSSSGESIVVASNQNIFFNTGATSLTSQGTNRMLIASDGKATFNSNITIPASVPSSKGGKALRFPVDADVSGTTELEFFTPLSSPASTLTVNNTLTAGAIDIPSSGTSDTRIEIGTSPLANHFAYIDLVGDTTYTDYGLRLIRSNGGANTTSQLVHRGTGSLFIEAQDAGSVILKTNASDALKVDSSQNVLIGGTSAFANNATTINSSGLVYASRAGNKAGHFNLQSSDGDIVVFSKDGTTIGSIGTAGNSLYIDGGSSNYSLMLASDFRPRTANGAANNDGVVDLGDSQSRFKDLHLSGTITSSVNANRFFKYRSGSIADFEVSSDNNSNAVMTVTGTGTADIFKVRDNTADVFTVADGGNATFAGSIITSKTSEAILLDSAHSKTKIGLFGGIGTGAEYIGTSAATLELSGTNINLNGASGSGTPNLKMGTTTVIDSSRNLQNIGTISSGAITSTGASAFTDLAVGGAADSNYDLKVYGLARFQSTANFVSSGNAIQIGGTTIVDASRNLTNIGTISSGDITIADGVTPVLTLSDTGNAGGGGASGKILFKNTGGDAMGIGYTANVVTDSDMIISTNAGGTYGGYLGLDAGGITDAQSDIILEPKTNVRIATGQLLAEGTASNSVPKYSFEGDTNTGLGYIGADQVGLIIGGSRVFYVSAGSSKAFFQNLSNGVDIANGLNVSSGVYQVAGTTVIDASRNLTNIGTYSGSGNLTVAKSTTPIVVFETSATSGQDATLKIRGARTASNTSDIATIFLDNKTSSPYTMAKIIARDPSANHGLGNGQLTLQTSSGGTLSNNIVCIQSNIKFATSGQNRAEITSAGVFNCANDVAAFGTLSDITLKENIKVIENPLDKVKQIRGVNFSYKKDGRKSTGLIAQELEKVLPNAIFNTHELGDDKEIKAIRYGNVVGLLVEAIKEQQEQIEELKAKLEEVA